MTVSNVPPTAAVSAINSGMTRWSRRVEIYESDGTTLWIPNNGDTKSRLIDGSINLDYSRDERRTLDITLANDDGMLSSSNNDGFWYDKILKPYRGVYYSGTTLWETQMGEFYIDRIDDDIRTDNLKVTARDPWKKLLTSRLASSMSFPPGTYISTLVKALAANAGITKFKIPVTNETIGQTLDIERGTDRGAVMKQAAATRDYDLWFDNQGYLTMTKIPDPTLDAPQATFSIGPTGNLVSYNKSVNDSRLYNHIFVYGDREAVQGGEVLLPYFGEAVNNNPDSPTSVDRIGDRVYTYASSFFTSDEQCEALAASWLRIYGLESYEINFSSLYYPWLEVGKVVNVNEPDSEFDDPTKFMLDTIDFPLGLSPMSATGKRVIAVS